MHLLLLFISILPVFLVGLYIYRKDTEKEPKSLLIGLIFSGLLAGIMVIFINVVMALVLSNHYISDDVSNYDFFHLFLMIFFEIALVEEVCKWFMVKVFGYKSKEYDQIYDIIVYSSFVALGFAGFENIFYVFQGGMQVGILRAIFSVPGHAAFGIFMGYYMGWAKFYKNKDKFLYYRYMFLSIFIPALLHTGFNFCLYTSGFSYFLIFLGFIIIIYITAVCKINQFVRMDNTLD
ncbi:MAG: PrsW family glutamic-type intramembrane protease [bacterium]|nr:PrsW family glutamic-type intramembrane protease [bacterium]